MIERSFPDQKFIGEDPEAPKIDGGIILASLEDLRGHIIKGPTVSCPSLSADSCPSKIT